jgi:hypothetical protein
MTLPDTFKTGACVGYIWGATSTAAQAGSICLKGAQANQLIDVIKQWLQTHPEIRQNSASSLVIMALMEKFPCNRQ